MSQFTWIKLSIFVMLPLQFAEVTGESTTSFMAREGENVTLPCKNVIKNQDKCGQTSWLHRDYESKADELIKFGQIGDSENVEAKSSRLSVTADCSLVIKNVSFSDFGHYTCRQFNKAGQPQGGDEVVLNVLYIDHYLHEDYFSLFCGVLTPNKCDYTVQWFFYGDKNDDMHTDHLQCEADLVFPVRHVNQKSKFYKSLKCNVTENMSGKTLLFDVGSPSSHDKTESKGSRTMLRRERTRTVTQDPKDHSRSPWWTIIVVLVGLAALITAVVVYKWMTTKGNETPMDDNAQHNNEDEVTVTYENGGEPSASVRLH